MVECRKIKRCICTLILAFALLAVGSGCARKGLIAENHSADFYHVPRLLPEGTFDENPKFLYYGDSRPGWRVQEKFLKKRNWATWKMLIIPFYEVYWLGNGVVGGINRLRRVPDYGVRQRLMMRDAVYDAVRNMNLNFIMHGGDMPTDGRYANNWAQFIEEYRIQKAVLGEIPFLPVMGNHEKGNDPEYGFPNYDAVFDYPQFYVLDFPDVAIFVTDSDIIIDQYGYIDDDEQEALFRKWFVAGDGSEQASWLESELASRSQKFKVVVMHHPPVSFGKHYTDWNKEAFGIDLNGKRLELLSMLQKQGVQLVLCSHEHIYEHNIVHFQDREGSGIHIVVSGGAGAPLRSVTSPEVMAARHQAFSEQGLDVRTVRQEEVYHYCLVDVNSERINIKVMEVTGKDKKPLRLVEGVSIADTVSR